MITKKTTIKRGIIREILPQSDLLTLIKLETIYDDDREAIIPIYRKIPKNLIGCCMDITTIDIKDGLNQVIEGVDFKYSYYENKSVACKLIYDYVTSRRKH